MKMLELPGLEIAIFAFVVVVYLAAAIVGIVELLAGGEKYKRFLLPLVSLAVTLEAVILILRTIAIIVFVLVRFAIVGVAILGATQHDFSLYDQPVSPVVTYV